MKTKSLLTSKRTSDVVVKGNMKINPEDSTSNVDCSPKDIKMVYKRACVEFNVGGVKLNKEVVTSTY